MFQTTNPVMSRSSYLATSPNTHSAHLHTNTQFHTDQSSYVHDHDEELVVLVGDGQFDLAELFPWSWRPQDLCNTQKHTSDQTQFTSCWFTFNFEWSLYEMFLCEWTCSQQLTCSLQVWPAFSCRFLINEETERIMKRLLERHLVRPHSWGCVYFCYCSLLQPVKPVWTRTVKAASWDLNTLIWLEAVTLRTLNPESVCALLQV